MRILLAGGGTYGSVSPLIAIAEYLETTSSHQQGSKRNLRILWVGSYQGPEWRAVSRAGISGVRIHTGKLRRYMSLWNVTDSFFLFLGLVQSLYHIVRFRPTVIVNAGSYIGVPVLWAGWLLGIPSVLLQLDIRPSLSNSVTAFTARAIAASCDGAAAKLPRSKTVVTGIPLRKAIVAARETSRQKQARDAIRLFLGIRDERPYVLVVGGSSGAQYLNDLARSLDTIAGGSYHIVLISGSRGNAAKHQSESFHEFSFLHAEFAGVLACADIVVCRAGMGTISELAYLKKAAIVIPIPHSHQQDNAAYFEKEGGIIQIGQEHADAETVNRAICKLIRDAESRSSLGEALSRKFFSDASKRVADLFEKL